MIRQIGHAANIQNGRGLDGLGVKQGDDAQQRSNEGGLLPVGKMREACAEGFLQEGRRTTQHLRSGWRDAHPDAAPVGLAAPALDEAAA